MMTLVQFWSACMLEVALVSTLWTLLPMLSIHPQSSCPQPPKDETKTETQQLLIINTCSGRNLGSIFSFLCGLAVYQFSFEVTLPSSNPALFDVLRLNVARDLFLPSLSCPLAIMNQNRCKVYKMPWSADMVTKKTKQ